MKIALYIEDGLHQIVLTPASEHERSILRLLTSKEHALEINHGSFYECRGGWVRFAYAGYRGEDNDSAMIVLRRKPEALPGGSVDSEVEP